MYSTQEVNSWDMSDYENDCLLNGSDPMILSWIELEEANAMEDYMDYVLIEQQRILSQ